MKRAYGLAVALAALLAGASVRQDDRESYADLAGRFVEESREIDIAAPTSGQALALYRLAAAGDKLQSRLHQDQIKVIQAGKWGNPSYRQIEMEVMALSALDGYAECIGENSRSEESVYTQSAIDYLKLFGRFDAQAR